MEQNTIDEILMSGFSLINVKPFYDLPISEQNHEGKRSVILMKYIGEMPVLCPKCNIKLYAHTGKELLVSDTTFVGAPSKLQLKIPRKRCHKCGYIYQPKIDSIDESRFMTKRLVAKIANLALKRSFDDIAKEYDVSNGTARNVFKSFIREKKEELRFQTPAFIGLDEIKIKKLGELTVITDLEHKTLYDMLQGRNQTSLTEYFNQIPNRERVLWVCTDMYRPFEKSIKTTFPNARWVIDHYHVVAYANKAMDAIRISIQSKMSKKDRVATKKGLAYTLRTRLEKLSLEDAAKIRECRENLDLEPLAIAFDLKEDFFNIYDKNLESIDNAKKAFADWEASIPADKIYDDFRTLAKTVHNFYEQIFNYWICPIAITNGFTECTNRIIRENNIRGRGNSFEILRGRTLYRHANLEKIENNGMLLGPCIPKKGPVFHYEEVKGIQEVVAEDENTYFNSMDYDPTIGLIPGINFDPETGEIFDETLLEDWNTELE
ncbi:MAG: ISL3 family transposase [Lachnospiraceae bacterium]|nr:ISL3 family transposase [Lachnospiraceae bacterium]